MNLKLSCTDFSFPLLPHETALNLISQLGLRGVDIGLFAGRSHLKPETELTRPTRSGGQLRRRLARHRLAATDVFLQVHENFKEFAINHPLSSRRKFARDQFLRAVDFANAAGSQHLTILPGVTFPHESRAASLSRAVDELSWRLAIAAKSRITLGFEPHIGSIADTPERALSLADRVPNVGFTLDYAHFTRAGMPDSRIQHLSGRATHFHARCARKGRLQSSFKENRIDFERAMRALDHERFSGWVALEYVWMDWEHCNEVDVVSETILLRDHLMSFAESI